MRSMALGYRRALAVAALIALPALVRAAEPPALDAATIIARMRAALDPAPSSTRIWRITLSAPPGVIPRVVEAAQARGKIGSDARVLTVVSSPPQLRGTAFMLDKDDQVRWIYAPAIERVRQLTPVLQGEAFLHSDFSYGDLGFVSTGASYTLIGKGTRLGTPVYQIEEVPSAPWYYSRIWTWVDADTWLPLRREFYAPGGTLWKIETFDDVQRIDGYPTPLRIHMEDVLGKSSTEIRVSDVRYGAVIPDGLFDPSELPRALASLESVTQTSRVGDAP
jgi:outer membrane lipoprotein-sorting protein